jgi:hypothetical protein
LKREVSLAAQLSIVATAPVSPPQSRLFASFSLGSALVGAVIGAAAVFVAMTFLVPPKVEIREVVRERQVEMPASDVTAKSEPGKSVDSLSAQRKFDDRFSLVAPCLRDLDTLIAERESRARQMARYESSFAAASSAFASPRISPEQYLEILRDLKF